MLGADSEEKERDFFPPNTFQKYASQHKLPKLKYTLGTFNMYLIIKLIKILYLIMFILFFYFPLKSPGTSSILNVQTSDYVWKKVLKHISQNTEPFLSREI